MAYQPGRLPAKALTLVQAGIYLAAPQARALARLQADVRKLGHTVTIARPAGGYRPGSVQHAMHIAGAGHDPAAKARWGLNTASTVAIADDPNGTHEDGTRVDLLVDGAVCVQVWFIHLAAKHGFTREFGSSDPNHYRHDGHTSTQLVTLPTQKPKTVTIGKGDTLGEIAARHALTLAAILALNPDIADPDRIWVGETVKVAR